LPRELPFDGQVKGNGKTLGFIGGNTSTGALATGTGGTMFYKTDLYNTNSTGGIAYNSTNAAYAALGVTLDPTKSGIILSRNIFKYLNFFIN